MDADIQSFWNDLKRCREQLHEMTIDHALRGLQIADQPERVAQLEGFIAGFLIQNKTCVHKRGLRMQRHIVNAFRKIWPDVQSAWAEAPVVWMAAAFETCIKHVEKGVALPRSTQITHKDAETEIGDDCEDCRDHKELHQDDLEGTVHSQSNTLNGWDNGRGNGRGNGWGNSWGNDATRDGIVEPAVAEGDDWNTGRAPRTPAIDNIATANLMDEDDCLRVPHDAHRYVYDVSPPPRSGALCQQIPNTDPFDSKDLNDQPKKRASQPSPLPRPRDPELIRKRTQLHWGGLSHSNNPNQENGQGLSHGVWASTPIVNRSGAGDWPNQGNSGW